MMKEKRWHKMQRFHARNKGRTIASDLLDLVGVESPPFKNLQQRGFHVWQNTTTVARHLQSLRAALNHAAVNTALWNGTLPASLNSDIVARGNVSVSAQLSVYLVGTLFCQFQQHQMKKFCQVDKAHLPSSPESLTTLFTHLLYDDSKRIVFCYVPKNGCSNMKRVLLILNGILPPNSSQMSRPSEVLLKQVW